MVASDERQSTTMRFDHGCVTIHDGIVGIPDVTFCGDMHLLRGLAELPFSRLRVPNPLRLPWRRAASDVISGELKVYGLASNGLTVLRVLRLLQTG